MFLTTFIPHTLYFTPFCAVLMEWDISFAFGA